MLGLRFSTFLTTPLSLSRLARGDTYKWLNHQSNQGCDRLCNYEELLQGENSWYDISGKYCFCRFFAAIVRKYLYILNLANIFKLQLWLNECPEIVNSISCLTNAVMNITSSLLVYDIFHIQEIVDIQFLILNIFVQWSHWILQWSACNFQLQPNS